MMKAKNQTPPTPLFFFLLFISTINIKDTPELILSDEVIFGDCFLHNELGRFINYVMIWQKGGLDGEIKRKFTETSRFVCGVS